MTTFIRLLEAEDKAAALVRAVQGERMGAPGAGVFKVSSESLEQIPGSPFAYWVSDHIRRLFKALPPFESDERTVKQGLATADDFRFVRAWWEVPAEAIGQQWFPFTKGGAYSPFYADVHLVVNWAKDGVEIVNFVDPKTGKTYSRPQNTEYYFRPGLTWPLRGIMFSSQAVPIGCVFSIAGKMAFATTEQLSFILALFNSSVINYLIGLFAGKVGGVQYEVGLIGKMPLASPLSDQQQELSKLSTDGWHAARYADTNQEISHSFLLPTLVSTVGTSLVEKSSQRFGQAANTEKLLKEIQSRINRITLDLYGIRDEDRIPIERGISVSQVDETQEIGEEEKSADQGVAPQICPESFVAELISWLVGAAFGRFDMRLATGEREHPPAPEPFDRLPICSPGMLTESAGLPVRYPPEGYPIRWPEDGILVDDPGIGDVAADRDIVRRIRQVIEVVWSEKATDIEQELCALLGVRTLRDYLRKPALFFEAHFKRYSKSKRKAPIYWPLSTASGEYTVWVYYPHLTADTLYKIAAEHVGPKISKVEDRIAQLEGAQTRGESRGTARDAKVFAELIELLGELKELRDELLRTAKLPYKPDLNDGVQITAAPLWCLFRLPRWHTELENTWKSLERGDYDWAHLAYAIRPEQVKDKCKTDKSLAIAHGLEQIYEKYTSTEAATGTKTKKVRTTKTTSPTKKAGTRKV